jgi:hypothetical protein
VKWNILKRRDPAKPQRPALVIDADGQTFVTQNPSWNEVVEAIDAIRPDASPVLVRPDGHQIRADGGRVRFTIIFRESAATENLLVIGRKAGGKHRGRAEFDGDLVVTTPLEWWSQDDGLEVFETFYNGGSLEERFALRDPAIPVSPETIEALIRGT